MLSPDPLETPHEDVIERRFAALWPVVEARFLSLYGVDDRSEAILAKLKSTLWEAARARPAALRALDAAREADPAWLQAPGQSTYTFYVDRFAGDLRGLGGKLDYLSELGVRWLHPLPLLQPRPGGKYEQTVFQFDENGYVMRPLDPRLRATPPTGTRASTVPRRPGETTSLQLPSSAATHSPPISIG